TIVFGLVAWGLSASMPLGMGLVVLGMASMGLATVARTLKAWGTVRQREMAALGAAALATAGAVLSDGGAPWLMGLAGGVGAVAHVVGDWLAWSGVRIAWAVVARGMRWWLLRSPVAFFCGQSPVESVVRWGSV